MRLLLDTHIWVWLLLDPGRLHGRVATAIRDPANELWLSSISVWEVTMFARKKIDLLPSPVIWAEQALAKSNVLEVPVTNAIALETGRLIWSHRDPADRMIVATARVMGLTLVTADKPIIAAKIVDVLANL